MSASQVNGEAAMICESDPTATRQHFPALYRSNDLHKTRIKGASFLVCSAKKGAPQPGTMEEAPADALVASTP